MRGWICGFLLVCAAAGDAWSQSGSQAPRLRPNERQVVGLGMSLSSSAQENVGQTAGPDSRFGGRQVASSLQGNLSYTPVQNKRFSFGLSVAGGAQHYSRVGRVFASRRSATTTASLLLFNRINVGLSGNYSYAPDFSLGSVFLPSGDVPTIDFAPAASDFAVTRNPSVSYDGALNLSYQMGARAALTMNYTTQQTDFSTQTTPALTNWGARGRFTYQWRRDLGLRLGYGRRSAGFTRRDGKSAVAVDDIDAGIDFNRALKLAFVKDTTVSFASGSAITSDLTSRNFTLTGAVNLDRTFGRSARARLSFDRGVRIIAGFAAPLFVDTATTSFTWSPSRRLALSASGSFATGDEGRGVGATGFQAWQGSLGSSFTAGRAGSFYANYSYTERGSVGDIVDIQRALPLQRRHAFRVGMATSVPLIRRLVRGQ